MQNTFNSGALKYSRLSTVNERVGDLSAAVRDERGLSVLVHLWKRLVLGFTLFTGHEGPYGE
jgi:hypothetical protein